MANMYESLSKSEKDTLRRLQAKAKRVQRQDRAFWQWVDDHAAEIKAHLGVSDSTGTTKDWWEEYQQAKAERDELQQDVDKLQLVADKYGCSVADLLKWIDRQDCVDYFQRKKDVVAIHPTTGGETL